MLTPLPEKDWDLEKAAHLLNRAGFGGTPEEIGQLHAAGLTGAVDSLLHSSPEPPNIEGRSWTQPLDLLAKRRELRSLKGQPDELLAKRREMRQEQHGELLDLRAWWLARMKESSAALLEKMTLFWHGHFATSAQKVKGAYAMWRQNETLRAHALGNFTTLLKAISRDPAMLVYLDLAQSNKDHPNENWSREVMELFTLGIGHYTEQDVRESARAFTGYRIDLQRNAFRFLGRQHDETLKTFLGHTGNFSGDDILDLIVEQPSCAHFIGRKVWRFFVEDEPSSASVETVAQLLHRSGYEMRPVLREIFLSSDFYSDRVRRTQIKSPVQFLVQSCKLLETDLPPALVAENAMRAMGQLLFAPPNVKGWDGGKSWVSTSTLLFRYNFANYLLSGTIHQPTAPPALRRDPVELTKIAPAAVRKDPEKLIAALSARLFQASPTPKQSETFLAYLKTRGAEADDETIRHLLHLMMSTPQFQLA
jgi:uncharacterized protein (DUF1800 family)